MAKERIDRPESSFHAGQEVRVKIIKIDAVDKKIGLSIKAALDEPEDSSLQSYQQNLEGDGSATLGDLLGDDLRRSRTDEDPSRS
jgi:small subunit ribosomal protein S1